MEPTTPYRRRMVLSDDSSVPGAALADGSVTAGKLASNSVTTAKIVDLAVTTAKINDLAVTAAKLAANAVETAKINDLAVTTAKINDLAVTTGKIANNAVTIGKVDSSVVALADVTIAAGSVLTLFDTPVQLVAAPGAGNVIDFIKAQFFLDYNSVAYTVGGGDDLQVKYQNAAGPAASQTLETTGFLTATADAVRFLAPANSVAPLENQALVLHCLNANPGGGGNSPLKVRTWYRITAYTW